MFQKLRRSPFAGEEIKSVVLTDLRGCESAEIAGISCGFDATTRFNRLSNITRLVGRGSSAICRLILVCNAQLLVCLGLTSVFETTLRLACLQFNLRHFPLGIIISPPCFALRATRSGLNVSYLRRNQFSPRWKQWVGILDWC